MAIAKRASILALLFICTIALACYYADAKKPSKAPASKAPVSKAPASKAPVSKAPASKAPASKAPISKAPVSKAPASKAPASKAAAIKAPASKAPAIKAPASKAPAIKAPASKTPAIKAPAGKKPVVGGPDIYHGKENMNDDALLPGEKVVNVKDFGAVADGVSDSTQAFMDAWRATCSSTQQSRLLVPAGRFLIASMFFNGPCGSPNPVTIQVVGHVLASKDISEYENGQWLFFQDHPKGIKIIGSGTFDGQGKESWTVADNCDRRRETCVLMPSSLYFSRVTNAVVQGITSLNPKGFHIFVTYCANFRLQNLKLIAPDLSPNTDGIHVSNSNNVIMTKNIIETGDDCISLIQGSTNITITNLKCGPGHGISIGSLGKVADESEVRGVHFSNCTLVGTTNGLRIKAWPGDKFPNSASDIVYKDILMVDVKNPIIIDEEYQCTPNKCQKKPSLVKINNVQISNVKGTTISQVAVDLRCSRSFPCKNVSFQNVDLRLRNNLPTTSRCSSVKPIYGGMSMPPPCLMS